MLKYILCIVFLNLNVKSCNLKQSKLIDSSSEGQSIPKSNVIQLHNIWALTAIKGVGLDKLKFTAGVPTMEIFVENLKISGFGGCNNYFANIKRLSDKDFSLGPVASTKMYCINIDEIQYLKQLDKIESYQMSKIQLDFYRGDTLLLSFKKVD